MKKLVIILMLLGAAIATNAQTPFWGATVGVQTVHVIIDGGDSTSETAFQIGAEAGYQFNKTWSVGLCFAYQLTHVSDYNLSVFNLYPFVRATFARVSKVDFFGELAVGYGRQSISKHQHAYDYDFGYDMDAINGVVAGLLPGIMVHLSPKAAITVRTQLLNLEHYDGSTCFGFGLNGSSTVGLQFTF